MKGLYEAYRGDDLGLYTRYITQKLKTRKSCLQGEQRAIPGLPGTIGVQLTTPSTSNAGAKVGATKADAGSCATMTGFQILGYSKPSSRQLRVYTYYLYTYRTLTWNEQHNYATLFTWVQMRKCSSTMSARLSPCKRRMGSQVLPKALCPK